MIKDLLDLVCSYLDPDTYKILAKSNPKRFTQLHKIKKNYEDNMLEITRTNIMRNSVILKCSMMTLFDEIEILKHNLDFTNIQPICSKIKSLIQDWFMFRIEDLIEEYKKVDIEIIKDFRVYLNKHNIQFTYHIYYEAEGFYTLLNYNNDFYANYTQLDNGKEIMSMGDMLINIKNILNNTLSAENQILKIKTYLGSINFTNEEFEEMKTTLLLKFDNENSVDKLTELKNHINSQDLQIFEDPNTIIELNNEIINAQVYKNQKLFQFSDTIDKNLLDVPNNVKLPKSCILSIYNIMETADQFLRISNLYSELSNKSTKSIIDILI